MCRPKGLLRFFRRFGLKTVKDFAHLSGIGYSFRGSYGGVWTYLSIGSKWLRYFFFLSLRAGGILQILQSDWFWERAVFLRSCPLTRAESLAASFTSLFVVVNEQNRWFRTIFLLKLALLLALSREKWILLFRQNIWRKNPASQPGKPLK